MTEPPNQDFFCPLPWLHLSIEPNGEVYSCCNADSSSSLGHLHRDHIQDIWKGEKAEKLREQFRKGQIPAQCQACVEEESKGLVSLRQASNAKYPHIKPAMKTENSRVKYIDLRLDNLCNLSCRICHKGVSSAWYKDAALLGEKTPEGLIESFKTKEERHAFFEQMSESLEVLYLAGGEPFLSPKVEELLKLLIRKGRQDLEIYINTNFSVPRERINKTLSLLNSFEHVYLDLSLDGFGKRAEYMRKGQKWAKTESFINFTRESYPNISLKLAPTISLMNILHLPDFIDYMITNFEFSARDFNLCWLKEPEYYEANLLPEKIKDQVRSKITMLKKSAYMRFGPQESKTLLVQLSGILNSLNTSPSDTENKRDMFRHKIHQLDKIRGEKFSEIFPELKEFLSCNS